MVSNRCKLIVKNAIKNTGLSPVIVELGEVEIKESISGKKHKDLYTTLLRSGFELLDDKKSILIEEIKNAIVERIYNSEEQPKNNFSDFVSRKLNYDYTYLSNLFSEVKGTTIEHCIIAHKIERAKELLIYNELSLTQIAHKLHYSSVSHLSNQFKKVTGLTPSFFKNMKHKRFVSRENVCSS